MPPSIADAIHLVFSDSGMGLLLGAGATRARVRGSGDALTSGPCDIDPVRHEKLREAWDTERLAAEILKPLRYGAQAPPVPSTPLTSGLNAPS
jgi:hypothetical protein